MTRNLDEHTYRIQPDHGEQPSSGMAQRVNVPEVDKRPSHAKHAASGTAPDDEAIGYGHASHASDVPRTSSVTVHEPWEADQTRPANPTRPFDSFSRQSTYQGMSSTTRVSGHTEAAGRTERSSDPAVIQGNGSVPRGYEQPVQQAFDQMHAGAVAPQPHEKKESEKSVFDDLSVPQVVAGALAAVTSLLLSNVIGLAGSVIGVAVASIVSAVSSQAYKHFLAKSAENIKSHISNDDDSNEEWAENIENGTAAHPVPNAAATAHESETATRQMREVRGTSTPHLGDKGAMTQTGIEKRASSIKKTKVQRGVIVISIVSALVAVVVYAVFINVATQGQGVGTKTPSIISTTTTNDASDSGSATTNRQSTSQQGEQPNSTDTQSRSQNESNQQDAQQQAENGTQSGSAQNDTSSNGQTQSGSNSNGMTEGNGSGQAQNGSNAQTPSNPSNGNSSDSSANSGSDSTQGQPSSPSAPSNGSSNGSQSNTGNAGNASSAS